jgi:hypothetical protein
MSLPITIPYTFATQSGSIPLSQLDSNFTTVSNAINGIGNGTNALANANITGGTITNVTLTGLIAPLNVTSGGTNLATLTANAVILGNGTGTVQFVTPGASGNVLTSDGTVWISQSGAYPPPANNAGKVLQTDGSTVSWSTDSAVRARGTITYATGTVCTLEAGSLNIANCVRQSTGVYRLNFTTPLANSTYQAFVQTMNGTRGIFISARATNYFDFTIQSTADGTLQNGITGNTSHIVVYGGF